MCRVGGWRVTIPIIMPLCGPILQVENSSKIFNYKLKSSDRAECGNIDQSTKKMDIKNYIFQSKIINIYKDNKSHIMDNAGFICIIDNSISIAGVLHQNTGFLKSGWRIP